MGISNDLWRDPQFSEDFLPNEKYIYLYCVSNPHISVCGCYEICVSQIAWETGLDRKSVRNTLEQLQHRHKVLAYNSSTHELLLPDWLESNWSNSPKWKVRVEREIDQCKCPVFARFLHQRFIELQKSNTKKNGGA